MELFQGVQIEPPKEKEGGGQVQIFLLSDALYGSKCCCIGCLSWQQKATALLPHVAMKMAIEGCG